MASEPGSAYIGRFAPSPTGPLHFGSLLAAAASYLQARSLGGRWLVRMEDIDPPREPPGADAEILRALEAYGFAWDGPVLYQSRQAARHLELVESLLTNRNAYPCACSRRELAAAPRGPLGTIYPGTCRAGCRGRRTAVRVLTNDHPIAFDDRLQGPQVQRLESESGDFVIRRRDGWMAYQLAVVADDAAQAVTEVVRGIDLLDSTPRQIHLQRLLDFTTPAYAHFPVAVNAGGRKLGKSTGAPAVPLDDPRPTLLQALQALRQPVPKELADAGLDSIWSFAVEHWRIDVLAGLEQVSAPPLAAGENRLL